MNNLTFVGNTNLWKHKMSRNNYKLYLINYGLNISTISIYIIDAIIWYPLLKQSALFGKHSFNIPLVSPKVNKNFDHNEPNMQRNHLFFMSRINVPKSASLSQIPHCRVR